MHRFFSARIFRAAPTLTALALMCLPFAAAQAESAFEAVEQSTEVLLKKLAEVQPLYEESPEKFYTEVDKALAPYIDFESFSRGVMAKHYRKATKQQRHTFQQSFRLALVKTYARSLVEFDNE
ncbi:MAG: MlaC/ttg2D family ABC transporter substrate-binding protein, partial [Pseudomonadales bacterium]